jgi:hypothetical protein
VDSRLVVELVELVVVDEVVLVRLVVVVLGMLEVTVKDALAESPVLPVTVIVYAPLATEPTTNDAVTSPPVTEHVGDVTRLGVVEDVVQVESTGLKLEPETVTTLPGGSDEGVNFTLAKPVEDEGPRKFAGSINGGSGV